MSFATCKTFGDCKPTNSSGGGSSSDDAAAAVVATHVEEQSRKGEAATPVLKLAGWALQHVADDDGVLRDAMKERRA